MKTNLILGIVIAVIIIGGLIYFLAFKNKSGYSSPTPTPSAVSTSGAPAAQTEVKIANLSFSPAEITIKAGAAVTFKNGDSTTHTVTADDKSFDSGNLQAGKSFSKTFDKAGTFNYHCSLHPNMKGKIIVQ